jgi:hypothetical protein
VGSEEGDLDSTGEIVSSITTGAFVGYSCLIGSMCKRRVGCSVGTKEGLSVRSGKTQMKGEIVSAGVGATVEGASVGASVGKLKG